MSKSTAERIVRFEDHCTRIERMFSSGRDALKKRMELEYAQAKVPPAMMRRKAAMERFGAHAEIFHVPERRAYELRSDDPILRGRVLMRMADG